jgi:cytosine/adenosine deaminase-related metal-dependent hydrolase
MANVLGDLRVRGGVVVTMRGPGPALDIVEGDVVVEGGRIVAVGDSGGRGDGRPEVDARGMLVLPGLVQAHVHLNQTLFRGLDDDSEIVEWLKRTVFPLELGHDARSMRAAADLAIAELLCSGTTSVLAIESVNHTDEVFASATDLGIRAVIGPSILDLPEPGSGIYGHPTDKTRADQLALIERWHDTADGRIRVAVSPRGTRAATPETWRWSVALAEEADLRMHTHVSENADHALRLAKEPGGRDIMFLHQVGALGPRLTMAHCVWLDEPERELLRHSGGSVCHCPSSNLKLASGIAPIPEYLADGINVALGADSATCSNTLDAFVEMRLAGILHKPAYGPTTMPAETVLRMATVNGAHALGLGDEIGSIEVGKRADLTLLRLDRPRSSAMPHQSVASQIVYTLSSGDVDTVVVDGNVLVAGGRLRSGDEAAIVAEARAARLDLLERTRRTGWERDLPPLLSLASKPGG